MRVSLDVQEMRCSMALWRDTLLICHPEAERSPELRLIQVRMLKDLICTLTGWLDLLKMATASGEDAASLELIKGEVAQGKTWAEECLAAVSLSREIHRMHLPHETKCGAVNARNAA